MQRGMSQSQNYLIYQGVWGNSRQNWWRGKNPTHSLQCKGDQSIFISHPNHSKQHETFVWQILRCNTLTIQSQTPQPSQKLQRLQKKIYYQTRNGMQERRQCHSATHQNQTDIPWPHGKVFGPKTHLSWTLNQLTLKMRYRYNSLC